MSTEQTDNNFATVKSRSLKEWLVDWSFSGGVIPFPYVMSCCSSEYQAATISEYNLESTGIKLEFSPPHHSDLLIIGGTITTKNLTYIVDAYEKMPDPKWVVVVGACPMGEGLYNSYNTISPINRFIPVDVFIPGCPPTPEMLILGFKFLQRKIATNENHNEVH